MKRQNNFTALKYAKRTQGLSRPEKQALVAIADACGTFGGVCTQSMRRLAESHGLSYRSIEYGVHGRHEGKSPIAGLVSRGLIYADGNLNGGGFYWDEKENKRTGLTVRWKIDARAWMSYLTDSDAADVWNILRPSGDNNESAHESAHFKESVCTFEGVSLHIPDNESAHLRESVCTNADKFPNALPQYNSPTPSPNEKMEGGRDSQNTDAAKDMDCDFDYCLDEVLSVVGEGIRVIFSKTERKQFAELCVGADSDVIEEAAIALLNRPQGWYDRDGNPLRYPAKVILNEFPAYLSAARKHGKQALSQAQVDEINRLGNKTARKAAEERMAQIRADEVAIETLKTQPFEC